MYAVTVVNNMQHASYSNIEAWNGSIIVGIVYC